jgi:hypothetical protein
MSRPYLEETQTLRDSQWLWVLMIVAGAAAIVPLSYGLYWQVGQGEQWGDEPMSDNALIGLTIFIAVCLAVSFICMAATKLELKIDDAGIHYRFVPYRFKWSLITRHEIESYELREVRSFLGICQVGYHRNVMNNSRSMNVFGKKQLALHLRNKRKILIGTVNAEGAALAMKKLFNSNDYN